uniref:phospholipase D-like domain-containing protein n=1 Tax=Paenirhodobacter enshiensis TaxID=1105367 RepID=UPI003FA2736C
LFFTLWDLITGEGTDLAALHPDEAEVAAQPTGPGVVVGYDDTPFDDLSLGWAAYRGMMSRAKFRVDLTTPYLVPTSEMTAVFVALAQSGVQVRIITPGIPDKSYVYSVTRSNYRQLVEAGVPRKAVAETTPKGRVLAALRHLPRALRARDYLWKGLALMRKVKSAGVPVHSHATGIRIEGKGAAEAVSFTANGRRVRIESEHIALHHGVVPNQQVTRLMRAEHVWDDSQMCFRPVLSDMGETSVAGLFVAGDGTGIGGAKAAALQGRLLGLRLAARAGRSVAPERIERLSAGLAREGSVRPFLEALYAPPAWINVPEDATIVCRCEEITAGQVRAAVDLGAPGPNQVKSYLRSGMGPCQGRVCGLLVSQIIAAKRGLPPQKDDYYRIRPPMKPLPLTELAAYRPEGAK